MSHQVLKIWDRNWIAILKVGFYKSLQIFRKPLRDIRIPGWNYGETMLYHPQRFACKTWWSIANRLFCVTHAHKSWHRRAALPPLTLFGPWVLQRFQPKAAASGRWQTSPFGNPAVNSGASPEKTEYPARPGKHTESYWKLPFIVDLPIKNGDVP